MLEISEVWAEALVPSDPVPTAEWGETEFQLPAEGADRPGAYNLDYAPYLYGIFLALDDPEVKEVYTMKAAQIGWTFGLIVYLGSRIATAPCPMVVMFPKEDAAREFNDEKLEPSIRATPALSAKINVTKSRSADNRALFKKFAGGFLKLVSGRSISSVKSTPAKIVVIEEPDDATANLKEQGNAITLLFERTKRLRNSKRVLGGTPSIKGLSQVEEAIKTSDRRVLPVECHDCGEKHPLDFDNVQWLDIPEDERDGVEPHEVYGYAKPETAAYICPHCGSCWSDYQRKENIRRTVREALKAGCDKGGFVATADFHGAAGFQGLGEVYSCLPGAGMADLVRDYLKAEAKAARGDESDKIVFVNSKRGEPYEYKGDNIDQEELKAAAKDYPVLQVPRQGLLLTVGIDVQGDRVAVIIRAWGREEESFLVFWGEFSAYEGGITDTTDPVWQELEDFVFGAFKHECGASLYASAISIDSSDGKTNDAVYHWVRKMTRKHPGVLVMAIKGSSSTGDPEIFVTPRAKGLDHKNPKKQTKADKRGIKIYQVGTNKAKDLIAARLKLLGNGPGRMHHPVDVREDYYRQMTGEVKAPHRKSPNKKIWQKLAGRSVEAWDCEVYALHAARAKRVHLMSSDRWDALEESLLQADMFSAPSQPPVVERVTETKQAEPEEVVKQEEPEKPVVSTIVKTKPVAASNRFLPPSQDDSDDPYL